MVFGFHFHRVSQSRVFLGLGLREKGEGKTTELACEMLLGNDREDHGL